MQYVVSDTCTIISSLLFLELIWFSLYSISLLWQFLTRRLLFCLHDISTYNGTVSACTMAMGMGPHWVTLGWGVSERGAGVPFISWDLRSKVDLVHCNCGFHGKKAGEGWGGLGGWGLGRIFVLCSGLVSSGSYFVKQPEMWGLRSLRLVSRNFR